jgi:hypothetical protein
MSLALALAPIGRPVRHGCRIDYQGGSPRSGSGGNVEVCN